MPLKRSGFAVLTKPAWARRTGVREVVLGSWARTGLAAALIVLVLGTIAVLGAMGQLGDVRYLNIPLVHPWPQAGYYQNPFNPTDRGDVVNASEAAKVKNDLVADGQVELQAVRTGDGSMLPQADTGRNLARIRSVLARNAADGVTEDIANQITKTVVGKLADPNDSSITWCVEEVGTSRVTYTRTEDGSVARVEFLAFDDRFWLVKQGGRYLIADVQISSRAIQT